MRKIIVDAELFIGHNNIVHNIIIALFNEFNNELNCGIKCIGTNESKRKVLSEFEVVYNDIQFVMNYGSDQKFYKTWSKDSLECLSSLASATELRNHLVILRNLLSKDYFDFELEIINFSNYEHNVSVDQINNIIDIDKYIKSVFDYYLVPKQ